MRRGAQLRPEAGRCVAECWGWSGPWRNRRGFDSLVQMACGIARPVSQWRQARINTVPLRFRPGSCYRLLNSTPRYSKVFIAARPAARLSRAVAGSRWRHAQYSIPRQTAPLFREPQRGGSSRRWSGQLSAGRTSALSVTAGGNTGGLVAAKSALAIRVGSRREIVKLLHQKFSRN